MRYKLLVFLGLVVVLLLGGFLLTGRLTQSAKAQQFRPMDVGGLPPLIDVSQLVGTDSSNRTLQMSVGLALRNQDQLNAFLHDVYDPSSPNYHQFLSVEEFTQRFGPSADQQQAVIDYLTQQGFTITQTYPNRLLVDFSGPLSLAQQVFGITINDYQGPDGRDFFSNATVPTLPAYIASDVTFVGGLDNANSFYHAPVVSQTAPAIAPNAGSNCPSAGQGGGSGGGGIFGGGSQVAYIPVSLPRPITTMGCTMPAYKAKARRWASSNWMATRSAMCRRTHNVSAVATFLFRMWYWIASTDSQGKVLSRLS